MKCPKCAGDAPPNSAFCPHCGQPLETPENELFRSQDQGEPKIVQAQRARESLEDIQASDRSVLWTGRYSARAMIPRLALTLVASLALIVVVASFWSESGLMWTIALGLIAAAWLYQGFVYVSLHYGHQYRLTPQTFFHDSGILMRSSSPIEIIAIDDVSYQQTILDRLLGVGTIRMLTSDRSDPRPTLRGIPDVEKAFATIDQARRLERRRRAVRVDQV